MIPIHPNILFLLKKTKGKDTAPLRCRVSWNGNNVIFAVGYVINVADWVASAQCCKPRSTHGKNKISAKEINNTINVVTDTVKGIFDTLSKRNIIPTPQRFKSLLNARTLSDGNNDSIFPIFDNFIQEYTKTGQWRENTRRSYASIRNMLYNINPDMTFEDFNMNGITMIIDYCNNRKGKMTDGVLNSTIESRIRRTKTFAKWANKNGYCSNSIFTDSEIKLKTANKPIIYLTWDELMAIYNYDFSFNASMDNIRDIFCLCCFTSLRYSDVKNLCWSDVTDNGINITTIKTNKLITIDLNKYSRAILNKHKNNNGKVFIVPTPAYFNKILHKIGELCNINEPIKIVSYSGSVRTEKTYQKWQLLSSHAGRRTFVCNALMLGIPAQIVMKWTGHSGYKQLTPYIEIADNAKRSAMSAFDKL
jgi:integrase